MHELLVDDGLHAMRRDLAWLQKEYRRLTQRVSELEREIAKRALPAAVIASVPVAAHLVS